MSSAERFAELWTDYLEGELEEGGYEELRQLLSSDESLIQQAADSFQMHRLLGLIGLRDASNTELFISETQAGMAERRESFVNSVRGQLAAEQKKLKGPTQKLTHYFVSSLLVVCLLLLVFNFGFQQPNREPESERSIKAIQPEDSPVKKTLFNSVATLVFAEDCRWGNEMQLEEGQRVSSGGLRLLQGMAILRFDGGAAAIMVGEVGIKVQSRSSARLECGEVVVRAPEEAAGFLLQTPATEVVDLGTEFAVKVGKDGATEVHVLEGEVAYRKHRTDDQLGELLPAGQAIRYDTTDSDLPREIKIDATRFDELLRRSRQQSLDSSLLVYEPFDYPLGNLPLAETSGGKGWSGPWELAPWVNRKASGMNIGANHFPVPGKQVPGTMMEAFNNISTIVRQFKHPVRLDQNGVYFFSVIVRWEPGEEAVNPLTRLRIVLRTSQDMLGDHIMLNLPSSLRPQIETRDGEIFTDFNPVNLNETQLWVGKIVARRDEPDEIFFRVFAEGESPGVVEPAAWNVVTLGVQSDAQLDTVVLSAPGPGKRWFDDIRIGTNWRSVLPATEHQRGK
tara:strand:- start:4504 stop:6198 length:1695 start_codon:yes stop_codon:yes gene_type:complete